MLLGTANVRKLTKASNRQLGHWAATGLLRPSGQKARGSGTRRLYTFEDAVAAMAITELRQLRCPLPRVQKAVNYLRRNFPRDDDPSSRGFLALVTNGRRTFMPTDERQMMEAVDGGGVWSIALGPLMAKVRAGMDAIPQSWTQEVKVRKDVFHVMLTRDDEAGGFVAQCRELPGALEQGQTETEALGNVKAAIAAVLDWRKRGAAGTGRHVKTG